MFRVMGSMMPYRNRAYDLYRKNFSEASAVGFLSAILFTVFCEPVKNLVDFGEKWMELSGLPYQMNIALLGFIVGYGTVRILMLMRIQVFRMLLNYQGWLHNPKSTTTKMWALMLKMLRGNGHYPCFYFEPLLPKLPVPILNKTLDRFLTSMKCLLSDDDFIELLTAAESFREKEGPQLQKYLVQRYHNERNWLADLWLNVAYLKGRDPIAVNVNCYAVDRKTSPTTNQLARAAVLINRTVRSYECVIDGTMMPQYMQDLIPITMEGYKRLNCTTRIPRVGMDEMMTWKDQKHVVIFRKGVYFKLHVYKSDSIGREVALSVQELYALLQQIVEIADDSKDYCSIGVFTAQNRDKWAKIRERLVARDVNRDSLECVDSSIAFYCLEEDTPKTFDDECIASMCGNGTNRIFDKCLQYMVYPNGRVGVNAEHAAADATLPGRIWEYFLGTEDKEYKDDGGVGKVSDTEFRKLSPPQKLEWELDGFGPDIDQSMEEFRKLANSFDLHVVFSDYGKGFVKTKRLSPDGYIQMALQLAYYRLHNKTPKTYESASTRLFAASRTETIRPVTDWSVQWVKAMTNSRTTRDQRVLLLKKAVQSQTHLKNNAVCGFGYDRHLFGLYCVCNQIGMELPALFRNKHCWMPEYLSTSQTPTKFTDLWHLDMSCYGGGFGTGHPDGYGVSYIIVGEDLILFHVSSNRYSSVTSTSKMSNAIQDAMTEMKSLLE